MPTPKKRRTTRVRSSTNADLSQQLFELTEIVNDNALTVSRVAKETAAAMSVTTKETAAAVSVTAKETAAAVAVIAKATAEAVSVLAKAREQTVAGDVKVAAVDLSQQLSDLTTLVNATALTVKETSARIYGNSKGTPGLTEKVNALTTLAMEHADLPIHSAEAFVTLDRLGRFIAKTEKAEEAAAFVASDRKTKIMTGLVQGAIAALKWAALGGGAAGAGYLGTHWPF